MSVSLQRRNADSTQTSPQRANRCVTCRVKPKDYAARHGVKVAAEACSNELRLAPHSLGRREENAASSALG